MTVHEQIAQRLVAKHWRDDFVYGVLTTTLKRPGRNRSAQGSNKRGWRYEERHGEVKRFDDFVGNLVRGLESGSLTAESAHQAIEESGYAAFVRVADSTEQTIGFLADFLRDGDNVWSEGWTPSGGPGNRLLHVKTWYDRSHSRIV